jgi:hypothetical protein
MKREKITPEQIGSNLSDPDFLDEEGSLIPTSGRGRSKEIGGIKLFYRFDLKRGILSLDFMKSRDCVGAVFYYFRDRLGFDRKPRFGVRRVTFVLTTKEEFIDTMLKEYPEVGVWILRNV